MGYNHTADGVDKIVSHMQALEREELDAARAKYGFDAGTSFQAAISPHDDYIYAGRVYAHVYSYIKARHVVMIGVAHKARDFVLLNGPFLPKARYGGFSRVPHNLVRPHLDSVRSVPFHRFEQTARARGAKGPAPSLRHDLGSGRERLMRSPGPRRYRHRRASPLGRVHRDWLSLNTIETFYRTCRSCRYGRPFRLAQFFVVGQLPSKQLEQIESTLALLRQAPGEYSPYVGIRCAYSF